MLSHTPLQSFFDDKPEPFSRTKTAVSSGMTGTGENGNFDEMLNENMCSPEEPPKASDIISAALKCPSPMTENAPSDDTAKEQKPSAMDEYLGGFNAVSGLLVRDWKKKELVEERKSYGRENEDEKNFSAPEKQPSDELSELIKKKKKENNSEV